jgi:hypothetical protein
MPNIKQIVVAFREGMVFLKKEFPEVVWVADKTGGYVVGLGCGYALKDIKKKLEDEGHKHTVEHH